KWEAGMTWISGMLLLVVVYWLGAPLLPFGAEQTRAAGIGISLGTLALGWIGYNVIWRSPLRNNEPLGAAISWIAVTALAFCLSRVLSDRAAYLHIGAMFGTIMAANV